MGSPKYSILGLASFFVTVLQLVLGTTIKYQLTYYQKETSWNTATRVCREDGGYLVKVDNQAISSVIEYFKNNDWEKVTDLVQTDSWIGLYDNDIPEGSYKWQDCTSLSEFTNWYRGEPNSLRLDHCIRGAENGGEWRTMTCSRAYQFICQKAIGDCTFSAFEDGKIQNSDNYTSTRLPDRYESLDTCKSQCRGGDNSVSTCWAVTYFASGNNDKTCILHSGPDPTPLMSADNTEPEAGAMSSRRICYEALNNREPIQASFIDDSRVPVNCTEPTDDANLANTDAPPSRSEDTNTAILHTETLYASSSILADQPQITTAPLTDASASANTMTLSSPCVDLTCTLKTMGNPTTSTELDVQTSSIGQVHKPSSSLCPCPCSSTLTKEESAVVISSILEELVIEKENVSSNKRKYVSAQDDRPSAQGIGYAGGIILGMVFGGLVLLDLPKLLADVKQLFKYLKRE